jgi:transporter family protein
MPCPWADNLLPRGVVMDKYGFLFSLLAAVLWGLTPVVEKLGLARATPIVGVAIRSVAIAVILIGIIIFGGCWQAVKAVDAKTAFYLILGGIMAGLCGQWAYFKALKYWESSRVVPIAGAYPLVALVTSILFLGEELTLAKAIGTMLVVAGVILLR